SENLSPCSAIICSMAFATTGDMAAKLGCFILSPFTGGWLRLQCKGTIQIVNGCFQLTKIGVFRLTRNGDYRLTLTQYHNTFEIAIEKNAISERNDNVRTGLCGNSGQNFAGLSFCGFLLLYQRAEQLGNAAQIDICHLVSSLSWICF